MTLILPALLGALALALPVHQPGEPPAAAGVVALPEPLEPCRGPDILMSAPGTDEGGRTATMVVCRRSESRPVAERFQAVQAQFRQRGYAVEGFVREQGGAMMSARRGDESVEVFLSKPASEDDLVEITYHRRGPAPGRP